MTPKKPAPKKYDSGPSGRHKRGGFMFRAPDEELVAIGRAAAAAGVPRNDWLRTAARAAVAKINRAKNG